MGEQNKALIVSPLETARSFRSPFTALWSSWKLSSFTRLLFGLLGHSSTATKQWPAFLAAVSAQWTYRVLFAIPAVGTLWLVYYRACHMKAASKQLAAAEKKSAVMGYDMRSLSLTFRYFGPRMLATAGVWFANDVFFYGNKLFQPEFIKIISPANDSVMPTWLWNLVNVGASLAGCFLGWLLHGFFPV